MPAISNAIEGRPAAGPCRSPLPVDGSHLAARLAARLIAIGVRFECEQLGRERWRFAVAAGDHARLVATHIELCPGAAAAPWFPDGQAGAASGSPSC